MAKIKDVFLHFVESAIMEDALEGAAKHRPSKIANWLMTHYDYKGPGAGPDVRLLVSMDSFEDTDKITFIVVEHADPESAVQARELTRFDVSLPELFGQRDWSRYLDYQISFEGMEREDLHNVFAGVLRTELDKHGIGEQDSIATIKGVKYSERQLIGLFMEYRAFARNPDQLMKVMGLR